MNKYNEKHKNDEDYKARNAIRAKLWYEKNREKALARINAQAKLKEHRRPSMTSSTILRTKKRSVYIMRSGTLKTSQKPLIMFVAGEKNTQ